MRLAVLAICLLGLAPLASAQQTKWYFAEGATGPSFEQDVILVNPTASVAQVRVTFLRSVGTPVILTFDLLETSRKTIRVNTVAGLENAEVSTIVESLNAVPIVAERTMYWGGATKRGGHNETGIDMPRTEWYLAEGASGPFFHSYVLLANPGDQDATATVQFFRDDNSIVTQTYAVPAKRRYTIDVNGVPGMSTGSFGSKITSTVPILVERAMYWSAFEGGSDAAALPAPSTNWLFAEGTTLSAFQTFILLSNPNISATSATVTFHLESGALVTKTVTVPAQGRYTVYVNSYTDMADVSFATTVTSVLPIVAERAMYWGNYIEGTAVGGVTQPATKWGFAEGRTGVHEGVSFETFFLLLNPSNVPLPVHATFYLEDGTGSVYDFVIPANARYTLYGGTPPRMLGQDASAFFEAAAPFVAERATYWGADRYGGHGSAGVPWQGTIATPPTLPRAAAPVFAVPAGTYDSDFTTAITSATPGALIRVTRDGTEPTELSPVLTGVTLNDSATIRAKAFATNYTPSRTTVAAYTMQAPAPVFAKPSGQYSSPTEFAISQPLVNAFIRYTTDGREPTASDTVYTAPIQAPNAQLLVVKAKSFRSGWTPSATVTATYDVSQGLLEAPVATPAAGIYSPGQMVTLSAPAQPFVTIRFTTDGSSPTAASPAYTGPITFNEPATLTARAFYPNYTASAALVARYDMKLAEPEITPGDSAIVGSGQTASFTPVPGVTYRYTFDRNDPTETSPETVGAIWVNVGDTLMVRAFKTGWIPSDVAAVTYSNGAIPVSQGVFTLQGGTTTGFNSTSTFITFQLTNAVLDTSSVLVMRNGSTIPGNVVSMASSVTSNNVVIASATVAGLLDGLNEFEVYGTDSAGLEVYTRELLWAGNRTATVRVTDTNGNAIAGAQVRLLLEADDALALDGASDGGGNFTRSSLPTAEPFAIEVSANNYRQARATLAAGSTFTTVALARDNLDFSAGTQGWTGQATAMAHSEASDPLEYCVGACGPLRGYPPHSLTGGETSAVEPPVETNVAPCYPSCDNRQLLRTAVGSSSNMDMLLQTGFDISRQATYTFKSAPGVRKVRVRYRVQTAEIMPHLPFYPGTLPIPDSYTVRLRSTTSNRTATDTRTVKTLYDNNLLDNNQATGWMTLELPLDADGENVELYLYAYNDYDYGWSTGIWVDKIEEDAYSVSAFELHDFKNATHTHPRAATPRRLEFISAEQHPYYSGNTRVNGTISIRAPAGAQVYGIKLELLRDGSPLPVSEAELVSELTPTLFRTVGTDGVIALTASQFMFAIPSWPFGDLNPPNELTLTAQVRVTFSTGEVVTRKLGRRLTVLGRYRGTNRMAGTDRDVDNCAGLNQPFPCGGDGWARPLTLQFISGVAGATWNDFSNMNGGPFPKHSSHDTGLDIDGWFAGYNRRNAATAAKMIAYLNQYGLKISQVYVTYAENENDSFYRAIRNVTLADGRAASRVIRPAADHDTHFHWRLDLSALP